MAHYFRFNFVEAEIPYIIDPEVWSQSKLSTKLVKIILIYTIFSLMEVTLI